MFVSGERWDERGVPIGLGGFVISVHRIALIAVFLDEAFREVDMLVILQLETATGYILLRQADVCGYSSLCTLVYYSDD